MYENAPMVLDHHRGVPNLDERSDMSEATPSQRTPTGGCPPGCNCGRHTRSFGVAVQQRRALTNGEISNTSLHRRLRKLRGRAPEQQCAKCGAQARDWAQIHQTDGLNLMADYMPLCRSCHIRYDSDARLSRNKTSRHPGVSWDSNRSKWRAETLGKHLGRFASEEAAAEAVRIFRREAGNPGGAP